MFTFTDLVPNLETRALMGQSCVGFTFMVICINLVVIVCGIATETRLSIKRNIYKKRVKALMKRLQQRRLILRENNPPDLTVLRNTIINAKLKYRQTDYLAPVDAKYKAEIDFALRR